MGRQRKKTDESIQALERANKALHRDYADFIKKVGHGRIDDGTDVTHDGFPLTVKEAKFIDLFLVYGTMNKAIKESGCHPQDIVGKDYIADEIRWRLDQLKKQTIADADEIMQYFTKVMRGEEKDQFGLDAPLSERTAAARELAKRQIDIVQEAEVASSQIKIVLDWGE